MSAPNVESTGDINVVCNDSPNDFVGQVVLGNLFVTPANIVNPVANAATVNLSNTVSYNILRPTSDSTIAGAVINLPTGTVDAEGNPGPLVDGQRCTVSSTAIITTVTGTISSAPIPELVAMTAGGSVTYIYNAANSVWLRG